MNRSIINLKRVPRKFWHVPAEYCTWYGMKIRCDCRQVNNPKYKNYAGRGIKVCERWLSSFDNFLSDMGVKPHPYRKHSIDRVDNDGNYEPSNCRWATLEQRHANRRKPNQTGPRVFKNRHPRYADPDYWQKLLKMTLD